MLKKIFTLFIGAATITSCTIAEEVVVTETGGVDYVQKIEMPQMAAMMGAVDMDEKIEMNQISNTEFTYLEFLEKMQTMGSKKSANNLKDFSIYKDELDAIDFVKFRLDMRDNFALEVINRSKSVDEFNSNSVIIENTFATISQKEKARIEAVKLAEESKKKKKKKKKNQEEGSPFDELFSDNPLSNFSSMKYAFDGKTFSKTIDSEKYLKDYQSEEFETEEEKQMFAGMMKQMKFKYKYTFPRKIKSVNIEDVMFTSDGKSFIKEYSLDQLIGDPALGNFKVELED
ncbi:hypothetical protein [Faecalibacter bovis]|uniref:DUF4163 domain-containing protein n=1 Tax=Faecalibacter bovis TaxID=2898187 RepID=A0ABX7XBZ0_9FLAO|nr:hypothetical protein [Faecalibacter bovis]QTV05378.1 hypothetical protein J9309_11460 [Faecalibacter bovis]